MPLIASEEGAVTLVVAGVAWVAGIALGSFLTLPVEVAGGLGLCAGLLAGVWWRVAPVRLAMLGVVAVVGGLLRAQAAMPGPDPQALAGYADRGPVFVRGVVADSPATQGGASVARLAAEEVRVGGNGEWQPAHGTALVRLPLEPARRYGDYVELYGRLESPPSFDGFAYREYLARQGITAVMPFPSVALLGEDRGSPPLAMLHEVRAGLGGALARSLPEPQAALARGILLGQRGAIPSDLMDAFNRTNTTHVIAISGTNVTIIAGVLLFAGRRLLGRGAATALAMLGIAGYALLVGASPSVVRASAMGILFAAGDYLGRPRDATAGLVLAAAVMTLHEPAVLFDLGFQLSFLATWGLVLMADPLQRALGALPGWLSGPLAVTVAAEAATAPLIMLSYGQISAIGPVANLVVPPLLPAIMVAGGATAALGLVWPIGGQVAGGVAWLFLSLMVRAVETLGAIPWAALPVGRPGMAFVAGYYLLLAGYLLHRLPPTTGLHVAWRAVWSRAPTGPALAGLGIAAVLSWSAALSVPDDALRVAVLDVGEGDAILVRTPQHKILVDGGPSPDGLANALGRRLPFWDRGIDMVVLTHPDDDHLAGLIGVLERFPVGQVLEAGGGKESASYGRWRELIEARGIARHVAEAGQEIDLGRGTRVEVLHPAGEGVAADEANDNSVVLRLTWGEFGVLLPGDLGPAAQAELLGAGADLRATVLKVPHHGGRDSLSERFLEAVAPEAAIVSAGRSNRFGHPAPETIALLEGRGTAVYRTDRDGTVEVVATGEGYRVETQLAGGAR